MASTLDRMATCGLPSIRDVQRRRRPSRNGASSAYSLGMAEQWDLLFTLPNLAVPIPTPFATGGYAICSGDDPRLQNLAANPGNNTSRKMVDRFTTTRGEAYKPGCFLIRSNMAMAQRNAEGIRAFRNVCAISTTTATYATGLDSPAAAQWRTHWSDQFLFGYFIAGKSGWVQTLDGASKGADNQIPHQQPAAQFGKPSNWSMTVDEPLLERLFRCWRRCYLQSRDRGKLLRLFRALEVAFHASLFPADGLISMNDIGTRLALWVSAFEVLCHPGGSVNKRHVQKIISDAPYSSKDLTAMRYVVSHQGNRIRATLPEALYDDLYWARNQFLHGMPVRPAMLRYRQSKTYAPLANVAPVLFNAALVSYLNRIGIAGEPMAFEKLTVKNMVKYMRTHQGIERIQKGLVAAGRRTG